MAENKEENKKGGIVKIAIFAAAGLVLLGVGLGIGALIFGGGSEPDPSAEVSEPIITFTISPSWFLLSIFK